MPHALSVYNEYNFLNSCRVDICTLTYFNSSSLALSINCNVCLIGGFIEWVLKATCMSSGCTKFLCWPSGFCNVDNAIGMIKGQKGQMCVSGVVSSANRSGHVLIQAPLSTWWSWLQIWYIEFRLFRSIFFDFWSCADINCGSRKEKLCVYFALRRYWCTLTSGYISNSTNCNIIKTSV